MELIKDVAAIIGCTLSGVSLLTVICKPLRKAVIGFVQRASSKNEVEAQLQEIRAMLVAQQEADRAFREKMEQSMEITLDFTEKQCRRTIKDIFEAYKDTQILPVSEKKVLLDMDELYLGKLRKNHWGKTLLDLMRDWDVDPSGDILEFDEA